MLFINSDIRRVTLSCFLPFIPNRDQHQSPFSAERKQEALGGDTFHNNIYGAQRQGSGVTLIRSLGVLQPFIKPVKCLSGHRELFKS